MNPSQASRPWRRGARGQALILTVLLMLFVTVAVFLTFTIGTRTRRKIQLQSVADSTAYSLAVAEARAFNFYAWSNRAIVAHNVSLLSVHAHTTYLTFYEDLLAATANNFKIMSQRASGARQLALEKIANVYMNSDFDLTDHPCTWVPDPSEPSGEKCVVDLTCDGSGNCTINDDRLRGARWFHGQWHSKDNSNSCLRLVEGSRDHFRKAEFLRAHQLGVEAQLRLMMTGERDDMMPSENRAVMDASTTPGTYDAIERRVLALPQKSLAQHLAELTDPKLKAQQSAGKRSLWYYNKSVDDGMLNNLHKDYDEVLAGTRYPAFISQRGFQNDPNWVRLAAKAAKIGQTVGVTVSSQVRNEGTSRMLRMEGLADDPGQETDRPGPLVDHWPPVYSNMPIPPAGVTYPSYVLPRAGVELVAAAHRQGHDSTGFGESDGIASEDHGSVLSRFGGMRERTLIDAGRNTVWGDTHDWQHAPGHNIPGDNTTHSNHIFHGDLMRVPGHGSGLGKCTDASCSGEQRGVYRGHMRFKVTSDANQLWNMPRTLSLITRSVKEPARWPWDFNFEAEIPSHIQFTTMNSPADAETNDTMAVFAGGLVYFHKPPNSGEEYQEPPNLWNPFWRAKLHPVRADDALLASDAGHHETYLMLLQLDRWRAVNY